jgi:hypothetical protein
LDPQFDLFLIGFEGQPGGGIRRVPKRVMQSFLRDPVQGSGGFDRNCPRHRVRNIVQLEIQEDVVAPPHQVLQQRRPFCNKQLKPDLELVARALQFSDKADRCSCADLCAIQVAFALLQHCQRRGSMNQPFTLRNRRSHCEVARITSGKQLCPVSIITEQGELVY